MLVDEAYFHFYGETVIDLIGKLAQPGRGADIFEGLWARGSAAGRAGRAGGTMHWMRRVLSPYSVNSLALACLPAALEDTAYLDWYVGEVIAARAEFEAALDAAEVRRWPSRANFVLVDIGATA